MLRQLSGYLRQRRRDDPTLHVVTDPPDDEEALPEPAPQVLAAEHIESRGRLRAIDLRRPGPLETGFAYFADGVQRSRVLYYERGVPVLFGYVAAVVRERRERHMHTWGKPLADQALYFPYCHMDPVPLRAYDIPTYDTAPEHEPALHPRLLFQLAQDRIGRRRGALESQLVEHWSAQREKTGWLLVDGSLTVSSATTGDAMVGVVKSHTTQYFSGADQDVVFTLEPGHRTSVFRPLSRSYTPVFSWYVRLRANTRRELTYGLVRVEVPAEERLLGHIDELSCWLLAEIRPPALPDPRWDRLLYPVWDCEQYLKALAPSRQLIEGALALI